MKLIKTKIPGPLLIKSTIYKDSRGYLRETFRNNLLNNIKFPFDVMSFSKKNVLRGLHIQTNKSQAKIITVTHGKIYDVAVDLRKKSKSFGKYVGIIISDKSDFSFYIPKGFAHGFQTLQDDTELLYFHSSVYKPSKEGALNIKDTLLNIKWPLDIINLSKRDEEHKFLDNTFEGIVINEL